METYAGYVRVSRVGDRAETLISPQLQEREIREWAKRRGVSVEMLPAELDRSGGDDTRPILQGAIERIERGELAGVIVWNFARFTRSLASSVAFLESIEKAGGELHSTSEQIDATTPAGRMTRNFLFSIAQAEREQKAEGFDKAKAEAVARGIWTSPVVPFGYRKNAERRLEPDPVEAPVRAEVTRRRGAGHSWHALAEYIREETGRSFLPATIRQMVQSRTALGEARQGRHVNPAAHEPIVDRATWEAAQVSQPKPARGIHGEALLGGLVRCAGCSRRASSTFRNGRRYYSCRRYHAGGDCPEPASISAPLIEPYVTDLFFAHARQLGYASSERTAAIEEAASAAGSGRSGAVALPGDGAAQRGRRPALRGGDAQPRRRGRGGAARGRRSPARLAADRAGNGRRAVAEAKPGRAPPGPAQRLLGDLDPPRPGSRPRAGAGHRRRL